MISPMIFLVGVGMLITVANAATPFIGSEFSMTGWRYQGPYVLGQPTVNVDATGGRQFSISGNYFGDNKFTYTWTFCDEKDNMATWTWDGKGAGGTCTRTMSLPPHPTNVCSGDKKTTCRDTLLHTYSPVQVGPAFDCLGNLNASYTFVATDACPGKFGECAVWERKISNSYPCEDKGEISVRLWLANLTGSVLPVQMVLDNYYTNNIQGTCTLTPANYTATSAIPGPPSTQSIEGEFDRICGPH